MHYILLKIFEYPVSYLNFFEFIDLSNIIQTIRVIDRTLQVIIKQFLVKVKLSRNKKETKDINIVIFQSANY